MTYRELLTTATQALALNKIEDASLEAELLLRHSLNIDRAALYSHLTSPINEEAAIVFWRMLEHRLTGIPSAYVIKQREFFGLNFYVDERVLIPRAETELLVEKALELAKNKYPDRDIMIADIGTGCGAIAISLALNLPVSKIYATDISPAALEVACINCQKYQVEKRVILLQGDLLKPLPEPVEFIIANLPYIPEDEYKSLPVEIKQFEPPCALKGGRDGLDFIFNLLEQATSRISPGATLLLEIGMNQADAVITRAHTIYPGARIEVLKDLASLDRAILISL